MSRGFFNLDLRRNEITRNLQGQYLSFVLYRLDFRRLAIYDSGMVNNCNERLDLALKQRRVSLSLTMQELAANSGVSASHLSRIERGKRCPSAHLLRKIAEPLGFDENELFMLAGFLSPQSPVIAENDPLYGGRRLDPYVASVLAQEPVEVQHAVIGLLSILRSLAKSIEEE